MTEIMLKSGKIDFGYVDILSQLHIVYSNGLDLS